MAVPALGCEVFHAPGSKHLDDSVDLNWAFSIHDTRRVRKDGTITYKGKDYKVGRFS
jgi:hypothetical protein